MHRARFFPTATQVGTVIVGGIFLMILVYALTVSNEPSEKTGLEEYGHLPKELAVKVSALEDQIWEEDDSERKSAKIRELISLYTLEGRLDLAAGIQRSLAEIVNTAGAWDLAANMYFDWMLQVDEPERLIFAKYAIDSYRRSLELNPSNIGVQTDLAAAYMYYPGFMEQAVEQTNLVLAIHPDHVQANFNLGIMMARTKQFDRAENQFERVKHLTSETDPRYRESSEAITRIRSIRIVRDSSRLSREMR